MFKFRILMIVPALWLSLSPPLLAQEGEEAAEEVVREANSTHEVDVEADYMSYLDEFPLPAQA